MAFKYKYIYDFNVHKFVGYVHFDGSGLKHYNSKSIKQQIPPF